MFGIHRHQYPVKWTTITGLNAPSVIQQKVCATCGKIKRVVRPLTW